MDYQNFRFTIINLLTQYKSNVLTQAEVLNEIESLWNHLCIELQHEKYSSFSSGQNKERQRILSLISKDQNLERE